MPRPYKGGWGKLFLKDLLDLYRFALGDEAIDGQRVGSGDIQLGRDLYKQGFFPGIEQRIIDAKFGAVGVESQLIHRLDKA